MGKKSRTKGAAGELDAANLFSALYPGTCRELDQYQGKLGRDLRGCEPWCVQVKRQKVVTEADKRKALQEAESACDGSVWLLPVVLYREDRKDWRAYTRLGTLIDWIDWDTARPEDEDITVDMDAVEFIVWVRDST